MDQTTSPRQRGSRLGLLLFIVLLGLIAFEIAGRVVDVPVRTPVKFVQAVWNAGTGGGKPSAAVLTNIAYRPLPYVMYGLKQTWSRENQKSPIDGSALTKTSNSLGFRGREVELPKPEGRLRIVCLGGSTTYSDTVSDGDTYPLLLEKELRAARPGQDIEVVNAGVPSYTSAESLANLAFRCLDLQPDMIVLYEGINDYRPRKYRNFDGAYFHYRKPWNGTTDGWQKGEGDMADGFNPFIQHLPPEPKGDEAENVKRAGSATFRRNITSMAGIAKAHGVKVVLVTNVYDPDNPFSDALFKACIAEHNQVLRDVAAAQGATLVDMAADYTPQGQFADSVHMNPAGSLQMARLIAAGMLKGGL